MTKKKRDWRVQRDRDKTRLEARGINWKDWQPELRNKSH